MPDSEIAEEKPRHAAAPFDEVAKSYDLSFTQSQLGRWLREQVWQRLAASFRNGDHILELGCGTGEDAAWLAGQGIRVTATDHAPNMLQKTQEKIDKLGLSGLVQTKFLDLNELPQTLDAAYHGVLANFGVLNCVQDRKMLAEFLAEHARKNTKVIFVVMNRYCPWEILWYLLHGQVRTAFRRVGSKGSSVELGAARFDVWYPSPAKLKSEFSHYFQTTRLQGLGVFLPPSYLKNWVERRPSLSRKLMQLEIKLNGYFPWTWLNDHYILELTRK